MNKLNHKIGSVKVNLKTGNQHKLYSFMDQLSEQIQQGLSSSLDHHSQEWEEDMSIKIDRLRVDIQATTRESLLGRIGIELDTVVSQSLNRTSVSKDFENTLEKTDNIFDDPFEFFLNYGCLPWNVKIEEFNLDQEFERALLSWTAHKWKLATKDKSTQQRLIRILKKDQFARLLQKLDVDFLLKWKRADDTWKKIIVALSNLEKPELIDDLHLRINQLLLALDSESDQKDFLEACFDTLIRQQPEEWLTTLGLNAQKILFEGKLKEGQDGIVFTKVQHQAAEIIKKWMKTDLAKKTSNHSSEKKPPSPKLDSYFIQNAGLVILWPGFSHLFNACGYLRENTFVSEKHHARAVNLLHYLTTGVHSPLEYEMTFNKVLCGLDPAVPIDTSFELDQKEKKLADEIRKEVHKEWIATSKFSEKELIANFFLREGKITRQENGWLLQVERKAWDVLLDKLPWGIGVIRLPWMEKLIYVEW